MAIIDFDETLVIDQAQHKAYQEAGLHFGKKADSGIKPNTYNQVIVELSNSTAQRLSLLADKDLSFLWPALSQSELGTHIATARGLALLRKQSTAQLDGYPLPVDQRSITWPMHRTSLAEISHQVEQLKRLGIEAKIGVEIELEFPAEPVAGFEKWKGIKEEILTDLATQAAGLHGKACSDLEAKIAEISQFNAREVLIYDLIECDQRTRGMIENPLGRNNYYDGDDRLELRLRYTNPEELIENHRIVLSVLLEKATEYGLTFTIPVNHINFSFWTDTSNTIDPASPDYHTKGKAIVEGVARGVYDCLPVLLDSSTMDMTADHSTIDFGLSRVDILRMSSGRFEFRCQAPAAEQDIPATIALILASAAYGLEFSGVNSSIIEAHLVSNPAIGYTADKVWEAIPHLISNSTINPDGTLAIPEDYASLKIYDISHDLGLPKLSDLFTDGEALVTITSPEYQNELISFLRQIRIITKDGNHEIIWPTNEEGSRYRIVIPEISMDKIPPALRERIRKGESVYDLSSSLYFEASQYISPGEQLPRAGKTIYIDIGALAGTLGITEVSQKYVVAPGYDVDALDDIGNGLYAADVKSARLERIINSDILIKSASPEFREGIMACVQARYFPPLVEAGVVAGIAATRSSGYSL